MTRLLTYNESELLIRLIKANGLNNQFIDSPTTSAEKAIIATDQLKAAISELSQLELIKG